MTIKLGFLICSACRVWDHDVSRWGRFQDPNEAVTYELRCSFEAYEGSVK